MRWFVVLLLLAGCAGTPPQGHSTPREYPGRLMPPSALGDDFMLRQKLEATFGDREIGFEAVLQKVGDKLTLLGLTPFGSRAFLLEQQGLDVKFEPYVDRPMPFPPKYILLDIQRTLHLPAVREDGTQTSTTAEEVITERWAEGRLLERKITRVDGQPPGELTIMYEGGMVPGEPPKTIRFHNGWFGYRLLITTIERRRL